MCAAARHAVRDRYAATLILVARAARRSSRGEVAGVWVQVEVGLTALRRRSEQHYSAAVETAETHPESAALLLFYAVECMLKAALIRRRAGRSTNDLPEDYRTHDVGRLAKELHLPPGNEPKGQYRIRGDRDTHVAVSVERLHEAWRYGSVFHESDMTEAYALLTRIYELAMEDCRK